MSIADWNNQESGRKKELGVAAFGGLLMLGLVISVQYLAENARSPLPEVVPITVFPDFASIENVDVKKQQFFDYLQDYIEAENAEISALRDDIKLHYDAIHSGASLSAPEQERIGEIAQAYSIDTEELDQRQVFDLLLRRVDVLPTSLVLAQAATESAWGTSRFALEGNNLFGQWCYVEGCGLVPLRRIDGAIHEVRRFDSIAASVSGYFMNINTHPSYTYLRDLRENMRDRELALDAMALATGLGRYSERGDIYVHEVRTIIEQNDLGQRDRVWLL